MFKAVSSVQGMIAFVVLIGKTCIFYSAVLFFLFYWNIITSKNTKVLKHWSFLCMTKTEFLSTISSQQMMRIKKNIN